MPHSVGRLAHLIHVAFIPPKGLLALHRRDYRSRFSQSSSANRIILPLV